MDIMQDLASGKLKFSDFLKDSKKIKTQQYGSSPQQMKNKQIDKGGSGVR